VEAARTLAERAMESSATFDGRLDFLTLRVLARPLRPEERVIAKTTFEGFRKHYAGNATDAEKLLSVGDRKHDPSLPAADCAALTMLASQLMNLDEVLNK